MNSDVPQICVLLPVYNGSKYLRQCIDSILAQQDVCFELIVGDDCSTDDSAEIIQGYNDPRIHLIKNSSNIGLFNNLNNLLEVARAPLIHLLGQDDLLQPDCLAQTNLFFSRYPSIGMSYCKAIMIDEAGIRTGQSPIHDLPELIEPALAIELYYYLGCLPGNI